MPSLSEAAKAKAVESAAPGCSGGNRSRIPWAALGLAAIVLLPFLHKAYTIDDPVFLREAQHVLTDPLHPTAFELTWASERRLRASEFLPGGPAIAYLLAPLVLARWEEWAGHLLMLAYFGIGIVATAALARRFGLSPWAQKAAALLTASAPVALGMAGTMMPDVPAMMFTVLGMDRFLAWTQDHRGRAGALAAVFLALAVLSRINLVVLLPILGYAALRRAWFTGKDWQTVLPVPAAGVLALLALLVTRDPAATVTPIVNAIGRQLGFDFFGRHAVALFIACLTTTPMLAVVLTRRPLVHGGLLWAWLLVPLPVLAYVQIAPKYLLPVLPAMAILAAHGLDRVASRDRVLSALVVAGTGLGLLILSADARMAGGARAAAAELIRPRVEAGERVWFSGHWGFHWYAEAAGATPLTLDGPFPQAGDIIVRSSVDRPAGLLLQVPRTLLLTWGSLEPAGQVMSEHAGFFSDLWGLLPWWWERPIGPGFQVWRVTR